MKTNVFIRARFKKKIQKEMKALNKKVGYVQNQ